ADLARLFWDVNLPVLGRKKRVAKTWTTSWQPSSRRSGTAGPGNPLPERFIASTGTAVAIANPASCIGTGMVAPGPGISWARERDRNVLLIEARASTTPATSGNATPP